jgi:hypothetical protein
MNTHASSSENLIFTICYLFFPRPTGNHGSKFDMPYQNIRQNAKVPVENSPILDTGGEFHYYYFLIIADSRDLMLPGSNL